MWSCVWKFAHRILMSFILEMDTFNPSKVLSGMILNIAGLLDADRGPSS